MASFLIFYSELKQGSTTETTAKGVSRTNYNTMPYYPYELQWAYFPRLYEIFARTDCFFIGPRNGPSSKSPLQMLQLFHNSDMFKRVRIV